MNIDSKRYFSLIGMAIAYYAGLFLLIGVSGAHEYDQRSSFVSFLHSGIFFIVPATLFLLVYKDQSVKVMKNALGPQLYLLVMFTAICLFAVDMVSLIIINGSNFSNNGGSYLVWSLLINILSSVGAAYIGRYAANIPRKIQVPVVVK